MLLVDHDDPKGSKGHTLFDERVSADEDVDIAPAERVGELATLRRCRAIREQLDPQRTVHPLTGEQAALVVVRRNLESLEELTDAAEVLLGQHFGRGHERALMAAL